MEKKKYWKSQGILSVREKWEPCRDISGPTKRTYVLQKNVLKRLSLMYKLQLATRCLPVRNMINVEMKHAYQMTALIESNV